MAGVDGIQPLQPGWQVNPTTDKDKHHQQQQHKQQNRNNTPDSKHKDGDDDNHPKNHIDEYA